MTLREQSWRPVSIRHLARYAMCLSDIVLGFIVIPLVVPVKLWLLVDVIVGNYILSGFTSFCLI